jgi:general secretion pathway protein D
VLLQVTPRVSASGLVALEIDQAVSDVTRTTSSTIDSPTFKDRHINSSIVVHDGETIALGGLIRENRDDSRSGIPILSDIPLLGPAFRSTSRQNARTELIVLLTPRVVRNAGDAREITDDLRNEMRALKPLTRKDL